MLVVLTTNWETLFEGPSGLVGRVEKQDPLDAFAALVWEASLETKVRVAERQLEIRGSCATNRTVSNPDS